MYRFCLGLWQLMGPALRPRSADINAMDVAPETMAAVRAHLTQLEAPGQHGLTPRHVIEAAAFHFQVSGNWLGAPQRYPRAIYPTDPLYRAAYDVAKDALGEHAFYYLPLLANQALCCDHPGTAFAQFVHNLAACLDQGSSKIPWSIFNDTSEQQLGSAEDVAQSYGAHPIYSTVVAILGRNVDRKELLEAPHRAIDAEFAEATMPLIIFDGADGKRPVLGPRWMVGDRVAVETLAILAHRAGIFFSRLA